MLRKVAFSRHTTALVAIAWLTLGTSLTLTTATFADDDGGSTSASPSSASTGGGSDGSATSTTSGNDGGGNSAAVSSNTDTSSSVDSTTAAAETTTQAAAAASQSSGGVSPVTTPSPGPSVHQVQRGWGKSKWKGNGNKWKNGPNKQNKLNGGTYKGKSKPKNIKPDTGPGQATAAGVKTKVHVEAHNEGTKPVANAYANAKSGAIAKETTQDALPAIAGEVTIDGPVGSGLSTSVAVTGSESTATAHAEGGDTPTAYATAGSDMYALAVGGKKPVATTFIAGDDVQTETKNKRGQSWSISYVAGGEYTVAIATRNSAKAYASTYGAGTSFTSDDVWAAAMTWASAYAEANRTTASAWANAGAFAGSGTSGGMSVAAAASSAGASIRIELVHQVGRSSKTVAMECAMKVTDWSFLKTVRPDQRNRYMSCSCPEGWENATGVDRYCVRAANDTKIDVKTKAKTLGAVVTKKKTAGAKVQTKAVKNVAIRQNQAPNQAMPIASLLETSVAQN